MSSELLNKDSWNSGLQNAYSTARRVWRNIKADRGIPTRDDIEGNKRYKKGLMDARNKTITVPQQDGDLEYNPNDVASTIAYGLAGYMSSYGDDDSSYEEDNLLNLENPSVSENYMAQFKGISGLEQKNDRLGDLKFDVPLELRGVFKSAEQWEGFKGAIRSIESNVYGYDSKNGSYDGAYQMGESAKQDAADFLGITSIGHTKAARKKFRSDPELQERYYAAFVSSNLKSLMKSKVFRNLSQDDMIGTLAYAQLGATSAKRYIEKGEVKLDGNGFSGVGFIDRVKEKLNLNTTTPKVGIMKPLKNPLRSYEDPKE